MPGLLASTHKSDTGWVFDLRDTSAYDIDSDSEATGDRTTAVANKRTSQARLLKELDLSAREDTAVYNPNPWTIAKLNSACRPSSCATFAAPATGSTDSTKAGFLPTTVTTNRRSSASFVNKTCRGVSVKSVQTTLDKSFMVEKTGVAPKGALFKAAKLPLRYDTTWDTFTSIRKSFRTNRQPIAITSNKPTTVGVPEMDPVTPEDISSPASSTLLEICHYEPTELQASRDHKTLNLSAPVDPIVSIPGEQIIQERPYMLSDYPRYLSEYPVETNDKPLSTSKGHGNSNLSVSVDPVVSISIPSEQINQGHTHMLSDYPDYLSDYSTSDDPVVSMPSEQPTQEHAYMRFNYKNRLSEEYSIEADDNPENDQTESLDAGAPDATVGSEWTRTLKKNFRQELLTSSPNIRELHHTRGIIDPAQDWISEDNASSDRVPYATSIQYSPNLSDQNSRNTNLLPSSPSVRRRSDVRAHSPLRHPNNSTTELNSRLTRRTEDDDPDSTWSTLPTRRRRNKPVKPKTFFKHSGTFKLPFSALRSTKSLATDSSVVAGTTQNLPNGKQLTFYKPPPRKQFEAGDEPVILRIRKGNRQDWT